MGLINNAPGKRFIELLCVDSSNNYAMREVQKNAANNGDAYFAHAQTAGRGQRNKQWFSENGKNIILSVVIDTGKLRLQQQFLLNMLAALSVEQLFNKYTTETVSIKWPNDVYCRDRKAAGILIENVIRGQSWQHAIAGFGVNINQTTFNEGLKAISLQQLTNTAYDAVALAKELCAILYSNLDILAAGSMNEILNNYNDRLYRRGEVADFEYENEVFSGIVEWADENGNLIISSNGSRRAFRSGQLVWLL